MRRRHRARLATVLVLLIPALLAVTPPEPALDAVRRALQSAKRTVDEAGSRNEKLARLREVARSLFDIDAMARSSMGDVLLRQSADQQEEFVELFGDFMVRAYLQKLLFFKKPRFGYRPSDTSGEQAVVHTLIKTRKDDYFVDYVMVHGRDGWRATDIVVEGVSLGHNYGEQFQSLLRTHSFEELLDRLRRKVERHRSEDGS